MEVFEKLTCAGRLQNKESDALKLAVGSSEIGKSVFQIPLP
jgi:hypothetical protein